MVLKGWIGQSSGFIGQAMGDHWTGHIFKGGKWHRRCTDDTKHHSIVVNNQGNNLNRLVINIPNNAFLHMDYITVLTQFNHS